MAININLAEGDVTLIPEALDCYEYWELGQQLPRNNGSAWLTGDYLSADNPYWPMEPAETEFDAIEAIRANRRFADRLRTALQTSAV